eukprot:2736574-Pleurochrysis_carterae.AAC.1
MRKAPATNSLRICAGGSASIPFAHDNFWFCRKEKAARVCARLAAAKFFAQAVHCSFSAVALHSKALVSCDMLGLNQFFWRQALSHTSCSHGGSIGRLRRYASCLGLRTRVERPRRSARGMARGAGRLGLCFAFSLVGTS